MLEEVSVEVWAKEATGWEKPRTGARCPKYDGLQRTEEKQAKNAKSFPCVVTFHDIDIRHED